MSEEEMERQITKHLKATAADAVAKGTCASEEQAMRIFAELTNKVLRRNAITIDEQGNLHVHKSFTDCGDPQQ